jgi:hypothetical protein
MDYIQRSPWRSERSNLNLAREVEGSCSMKWEEPNTSGRRSQWWRPLSLLGLEEHRPILIKHVGVGPSSHLILKGRYLNLRRLRRGRRGRRMKPLNIVPQLHRISHFLIFPPRPLLLHLDVILNLTHAKDEAEELSQWRSGSAWSVGLPATTPIRPVLATGQTGNGLGASLLLWLLGSALLNNSSCMDRCLFCSRRGKPWILSRIELQCFCVTFLGNSAFATFSIIYMV